MKIGIVVIGYNRLNSIERLLTQLLKVDYLNDKVTLIVSIDKSDVPEVAEYARNFEWPYGEKIVEAYDERQGLRTHVLKCGGYIEKYGLDGEIILEDDIFPAVSSYAYAKQAMEYYDDKEKIAGIALYSPGVNNHAQRAFVPQNNGKSNFFMQLAQSWGQAYTRRMWDEFRKWYDEHTEFDDPEEKLPKCILGWPKTSWVKYFIKYVVYNDKYFAYPYLSQTTCFSEAGVHTADASSVYQVQIQTSNNYDYNFAELEKDSVRYDAFFERMDLEVSGYEDVCVDLYAYKTNFENKRYWLTTKVADYHVEKSYMLTMRPQELNVEMGLAGEQIFLYDTQKPEKNKRNDIANQAAVWEYDIKDLKRDALRVRYILKKHGL